MEQENRLPKPYYEHAGITIYHGDFQEILPGLPKVDLVLTDPPYGINVCNMTLGKKKKNFHRGDWDKERPDVSMLAAAGGKLCLWGGNYFTDVLPPTNHWMIWHKRINGTSFSECEMAWTNYGRNVRHLSHHWSGEEKLHPTMKPMAVMSWCLAKCPGEVRSCLDPFMGCGTTLVACKRAGITCIGIDREEKYCEIASKRLAQEVLW